MVLRDGDKLAMSNKNIAWVWRAFLRLMWWEHSAFLALIASGTGLILTTGYPLTTTWLQWKLALIIGILAPIEIIDSYFVHYRLPKIYSRGDSPALQDTAWVRRYHLFTRLMIPLFILLIPLIFYLAIFKPNP
ncbi:MAG: hypothetical protein HY081_05325 [Gammaproteobacteria bacterium]|nr:hypothetical protein [Gammaproteobacteria bacterium]